MRSRCAVASKLSKVFLLNWMVQACLVVKVTAQILPLMLSCKVMLV
jgi:hypothetical protein